MKWVGILLLISISCSHAAAKISDPVNEEPLTWEGTPNPLRLVEILEKPDFGEHDYYCAANSTYQPCVFALRIELLEENDLPRVIVTTHYSNSSFLEWLPTNATTNNLNSTSFEQAIGPLDVSTTYHSEVPITIYASSIGNGYLITRFFYRLNTDVFGNFEDGVSIQDVKIFNFPGNSTYVVFLLYDKSSSTYMLDFGILTVPTEPGHRAKYTPTAFRWSFIHDEANYPAWNQITSFEISIQTAYQNGAAEKQRALIALYGPAGVSIYQFEPALGNPNCNCVEISTGNQNEIPFGMFKNESNHWVFFDIYDTSPWMQKVRDISFFTLAPPTQDNSQDVVYLYVASTNDANNNAEGWFWNLTEFSEDFPAHNLTRDQIINPANIEKQCSACWFYGPDCNNTRWLTYEQPYTPNIVRNFSVVLTSKHVPAMGGNDPYLVTFFTVGRWVGVYKTNLTDTSWINTFEAIGDIKQVQFSENAMHAYFVVTRDKYELDAANRYYNICTTLLTDPDNPYLKSYRSSCISDVKRLRLPSVADFMQHVSICPPSTVCPSFKSLSASIVPDSFYAQHNLQLTTCEDGYYCLQGMRNDCPIGFICQQGSITTCANSQPFIDQLTQTCSKSQLDGTADCPDGYTCPTLTFYPIPAPPGMKADANNNLTMCNSGEWCSLGRSTTENSTLCPVLSYCSTPDVVQPGSCNCTRTKCDYCPEGTIKRGPCPAGYYCNGPSTKKKCSYSQYCPTGSHTGMECPAGHYCPHPTVKHVCPRGHYCRSGSVAPIKCPLMTVCPAGTAKARYNYGELLLAMALIGGAAAARYGLTKFREKQRKIREASRHNMSSLKLATSDMEFRNLQDPQKRKSIALKQFSSTIAQHTKGLTFEFNNLGLELQNGKKILEGVTGKIVPGRVVAVMGPSGAGKTTFLTTLAGKITAGTVTGDVKINGRQTPLTYYKNQVGYVPQEDIMLRSLTVKEILKFHARMRLPNTVPYEKKRQIVNAVIELLGLYDVRHSVIGDETKRGVSGGQRKRVNIGMELVSAPQVLFLDEPTSGLDSTSSRQVCEALHTIASFGLTVVTVIHQPRYEIFAMFDEVLLLGKGGRTVYLGPTEDTLSYFESLGFHCPQHTNPADFFMDVLTGIVSRDGFPDFQPEHLFEEWKHHSEEYSQKSRDLKKRSIEEEDDYDDIHPISNIHNINNNDEEALIPNQTDPQRERPALWMQFWYFVVRSEILQSRDFSSLMLDAGLVCTAGIFLGLVFANSSTYVGPLSNDTCDNIEIPTLRQQCKLPTSDPVPSIALMSVLSLALTATSSSLRIFGAERINYWRESSSGLSTTSYFLAKDIAHLPNLFIFPLIFLALFYSLVVPKATFTDLYLVFLALQFAGSSVGYVVSILVKPQVAQLTGVTVILIMSMFGGARPTLRQLQDMPLILPYIPNISFIRWALEAFYLSEVNRYADIYNVGPGIELFGYHSDHYSLDISMIFLIGFIIRVLALVLLHVMNRDKKK